MSNKKSNAIKILKQLLNEIDTIANVKQGNNWKSRLKDTLNLYVGDNSAISKRADKLYFTKMETVVYKHAFGIDEVHVYDESKKEDFRDLIGNAISYIQSNGIYKNPNRKNLLSSLTNTEIIGGIVVAAGLVYGAGNYFGKLEKDREILQTEKRIGEIEKENDSLKKDNAILKQSTNNPILKK